MTDDGLRFAQYDAYFIYSFLLDVHAPAPLHVLLLKKLDKKLFKNAWGVGVHELGVHPTLISIPEEQAKYEDIKLAEEDRAKIHRLMWFRVDCAQIASGAAFTPASPKEPVEATVELEPGATAPEAQLPRGCRLGCVLKLFPSGVGTCTFHLAIKETVDDESLLEHVLPLSQWEHGQRKPQLLLGKEKKKTSLWGLYTAIIGKFTLYLRELMRAGATAEFLAGAEEGLWRPDEQPAAEKALARLLGEALAEEEQKRLSAPKQRERIKEIILQHANLTEPLRGARQRLEARLPVELVWCDKDVCSSLRNDMDPQIPYVIGVGRLDDKKVPSAPHGRFRFMQPPVDEEDKTSKSHLHAIELAFRIFQHEAFHKKPGLLMRQEMLDRQLAARESEHPLRNRVWNNHMWLAVTQRASLLLAYNAELGEPEKPNAVSVLFTVFRQALVDICELIRGRWNALIVLNWRLDRVVLALRQSGLTEGGTLDEIVNLRRQYSLYLNNPMTYRFEGGSFTRLAQEAREMFWLAQLEGTLQAKFHQVDRMYEEHLHRQALEHLERGVE